MNKWIFWLLTFVLSSSPFWLIAQQQRVDIKTGNLVYTTTMNRGGQDMEFDVERSITEEGDVIVIVDKTSTPFGNSENTSRINKADYMTISQSSSGFGTSNIDYSDNKIVGDIADFSGTKTPIDIEKDGEVYGGGNAMEPILASLPMEVGHQTSMKIFNTFQMEVIDMEVEVAAKESIETKAGTFEVYRLDITLPSTDEFKQSVWLTADLPRMMVKNVMTIPQMGDMVTEFVGEKEEKKKKKGKKKKN